MTSEDAAPWSSLLAASAALWISGRLLTVAKRVRRRRVALAVLWAGDRCAELAR